MKKTKISYLMLLVMLLLAKKEFAQTHPQCGLNSASVNLNQITVQTCSIPLECSPPPVQAVTLAVNFYYLKPTSGSGIFDTIGTQYTQAMVDSINWYLSHIEPTNISITPPAPYLSDCKIRVKLKSIYHHPSSVYYTPGNGESYPNSIYTNLDPNAINIVFGADDYGNGGTAGSIPSKIIRMYFKHYATPNPHNSGGLKLIVHELGHCLGLEHSNIPMTPCLDDYFIQPYVTYGSNNIMSYLWDYNRYLSPKQIAYQHYIIRNTPFLLNTATFPNSTSCAYSGVYLQPSINTTISTPLSCNGDIIVDPGIQLTIQDTKVEMFDDSRIIVKPGGKLIVNNSCISSACYGLNWMGIEVWGGANQTLNGSQMPNFVGMIEINNSCISNADTAVFLGKRGVVAANYNGGGIIHADGGTFYHNTASIVFAPYFFIGQFVQSNFSHLKRCLF